jgi:hypothetical protein
MLSYIDLFTISLDAAYIGTANDDLLYREQERHFKGFSTFYRRLPFMPPTAMPSS